MLFLYNELKHNSSSIWDTVEIDTDAINIKGTEPEHVGYSENICISRDTNLPQIFYN